MTGLLKQPNMMGKTKTVKNCRKVRKKTYKIFSANQTKWRLDENYTITFTHKLTKKKFSFLIITRLKPRRQLNDRCTIENCDFSDDFFIRILTKTIRTALGGTHTENCHLNALTSTLTYGARLGIRIFSRLS